MKRRNLFLAGSLCATLLLPSISPAQNLPVTTGLKLWLKADAGVTTNSNGEVTAWADQSPLGNNAVSTNAAQAPRLEPNSLNGKPTLRFPGGTRYLDVPNSASITGLADDVTILVLVNHDDFATYRTSVSKTSGNGPAPFDIWHNASVNGGRVSLYLGDGSGTGYQQIYSTTAPQAGVYNVMGVAWGSGVVNHYLNDLGNGQGTYTTVPADAGGPFRIGSREDKVTQLQGNLAEVLVYQPRLSDADRTAVINYLVDKWGLAFNKPPTVSISTPANGTTVPTGSLGVTIDASDPEGALKRVDLLNRGTVIASFDEPPYQLTLNMLNPGTASLSAVAVDQFDRTATSAPVSITITGTALNAPVTSGLKVWLSADAGTTVDANNLVSAWTDQSGSGNDAMAITTPLLVTNVVNGKPVLRFGQNPFTENQALEVSEAGTAFTSSNFTTFAVARFDNFATFRNLWSKTAAGVAAPIDWWFAPNTGIGNAFRGDGATFGGPVPSTVPVPAGQFAAVGLTVDGTGVSHQVGFAETGSGNIANTPVSGGLPLRIGQRDDAGTQMLGDIAEILIYDRALSSVEKSNVVNYLSSKYGLAQAIIGNLAPVATVTTPQNNSSVAMGAVAQFEVTGTDPDGSVAQVELMANGARLATLTESPYRIAIEFVSPGTVNLTGIVSDNWGTRATSAPVTITVTGTAPTSPPTTELRLWLKADDGATAGADNAVTGWADKSGQGNNAAPSGTSPTLVANAINGKPAVRFDGIAAALEVATDASLELTNDFATFAMVKMDDFATYRALWAKTAGALPGIDYYLQPNTGIPNFLRGDSIGGFGSLAGNRPVLAGEWTLIGYGMQGARATHYLDGMQAGQGNINAAFVDSGLPLLIGTRDDRVTLLKGDLAEMLIYGRALTEAERTQVEAYLAGKYGRALVRMAAQAPVISMTSPVNNSTSAAPATLSLAMKVNESFYRLARVEFLADELVISSQDVSGLDPQPATYSLPMQAVTPGTLTVRGRAVDIWGNVGETAPINVTVTGTGPAAPPAQGLALWLKADAGVSTNTDGTVTAWADQSGNGNNATQESSGSAPALALDPVSGRPTLMFEAGDFLDVASAPSVVIEGDISSFAAFSVPDLTAVRSLWAKASGARAYPHYYFVRGGVTVLARGNTNGVSEVAATNAVRAGIPAVAGFTIEGSDTAHYLNGRANGRSSLGYGALDQGTPLRIGAAEDLSNPFSGNISEILIYNRALPAADVQLASTYLAARNGVVVLQAPTGPGQPSLTITRVDATNVRLSWPADATGYVLESSDSLANGSWTPVTPAPSGNETVVNASSGARYYRLRGQ